MEETADEGVLDHTLAKLLPVVTTLRTHLDPPPEQPAQIPCILLTNRHPSEEEQQVMKQKLEQEKVCQSTPTQSSIKIQYAYYYIH